MKTKTKTALARVIEAFTGDNGYIYLLTFSFVSSAFIGYFLADVEFWHLGRINRGMTVAFSVLIMLYIGERLSLAKD